MQIGDIVKWTFAEVAYSLAFGYAFDLHLQRQCGIIIDRNPEHFFVLWQNKEIIAQKPSTIEVVNEQ